MSITLLFFAQAARVVGADTEQLDWEAGSLDEVESSILQRHPELAAIPIRLALDEEFVPGDSPVTTGQTVAVLPPFSGG